MRTLTAYSFLSFYRVGMNLKNVFLGCFQGKRWKIQGQRFQAVKIKIATKIQMNIDILWASLGVQLQIFYDSELLTKLKGL